MRSAGCSPAQAIPAIKMAMSIMRSAGVVFRG
jgi:hypothetical protein